MRRAFLAVNNPILLDDMILTETLFSHLWEIDETARRRVKQIMTEFLKRNPAPDKATQQLEWVQYMSSLKSQAEEIVNAELIFGNRIYNFYFGLTVTGQPYFFDGTILGLYLGSSCIVLLTIQELSKAQCKNTDNSDTDPFLSVGVSAYMARVRMRTDQNIY